MLKGRAVDVLSVGAFAPEKRLTNSELEKMVDTSDEWIVTRTGIKERRIAEPEIAVSDMAFKASEIAIKRAGIDPSEIQMVVACTATPDMLFPATACLIQSKLGLQECICFDIEAGCSGFVYGLSIASQFITAGTLDTVLVVGGDTLSRITNWEDRNTCVLFGDGAGAVVLKAGIEGNGILGFNLSANGSFADVLHMPAGGSKRPSTADTVQKKLNTIHMEGREVFKQAVIKMSESTNKLLSDLNISIEEIDLYIPHQANIRIIEAVSKRLGIPTEKVFTNVERYGNTSCASIPIAWNEAFESGKLKKGDLMLLTAVGAGLTWGSLVARWNS